MTEETKPNKPGDRPAERTGTIKPAEKAVADSHDRKPLLKQQLADKAYEESPTRPPREKVSGLFGKQHLGHVHRIEKGETLKSVVQKRLGADASEEEIHHHMKEVARISGFKDHSEIKPGHAVQFPDQSEIAVGSTQAKDSAGKDSGLKITKSADPPATGLQSFETLPQDVYNLTLTQAQVESFIRSVTPTQLQKESSHLVSAGETLFSMARNRLGHGASKESINFYETMICSANGISDAQHLKAGQQVILPSFNSDGSVTYNQKDSQFIVQSNGNLHVENRNGTSYDRIQLDNAGSYIETHSGPKPEDIYTVDYSASDKSYTTRYVSKEGNYVTSQTDGTVIITYPNGVTETRSPNGTVSAFDSKTGITIEQHNDGAKVFYYPDEKDGSPGKTEAFDPDATKTTKWAHGTIMVENKDTGTGSMRTERNSGEYKQEGWGPQPHDNYEENYDPKTGVTTRIEAAGTPLERKTVQHNGITTVQNTDGTGYQRNPDGSEHHFGPEAKDNFIIAPDHKHVDQAKEKLEAAVRQNVPADKQSMINADMKTFEQRLRDHHVSPEETAKTYEQLTKLLTAGDTTAVVSAANRATCAVSMMHQLAYPEHTDQGQHNTCNVTTVAERLLTREPSKAAEIVTTAVLTGNWKAPDGKLISIGKDSLQPGQEEIQFPPKVDGARSYCTQILDLVLANDATQRRIPPQYYRQSQATNSFPGDTGERLYDQHGKVINEMTSDASGWKATHEDSPELAAAEICRLAERIMSDHHFFLARRALTAGLDAFHSEEELEGKLQMMRDQGKFPVIIQVDANKRPFSDIDLPTLGGHVVSITNYDPVHHRVKISNQWGIKDDKWVDASLLYENTLNR